MSNGLDEEKGRILVPFDLKVDVILPLERLEHGLKELSEKLDNHIAVATPMMKWVDKATAQEEREAELKAKTKRYAIYAISVGGPIIFGILAAVLGWR